MAGSRTLRGCRLVALRPPALARCAVTRASEISRRQYTLSFERPLRPVSRSWCRGRGWSPERPLGEASQTSGGWGIARVPPGARGGERRRSRNRVVHLHHDQRLADRTPAHDRDLVRRARWDLPSAHRQWQPGRLGAEPARRPRMRMHGGDEVRQGIARVVGDAEKDALAPPTRGQVPGMARGCAAERVGADGTTRRHRLPAGVVGDAARRAPAETSVEIRAQNKATEEPFGPSVAGVGCDHRT